MCFECPELGGAEDWMKVVAAGSVLTEPCACITVMITSFIIVNYLLVIADLVFGAISIIETDTKITELTPIIEANLTGYLKADIYHNESNYSPYEPGSSNLMVWKVSYFFLYVYALGETVMLIYILFGFKLRYKKTPSHNETPSDHMMGHVVIGLLDILENIFVSVMAYGQLIFARSSPINRYIFVNGVSASETTGLVVATASVVHILNSVRLISDARILKKLRKNRRHHVISQKKWVIKFVLHIAEYLSSGLALAFAITVRLVANEHQLQFGFNPFSDYLHVKFSKVFQTTGAWALFTWIMPCGLYFLVALGACCGKCAKIVRGN